IDGRGEQRMRSITTILGGNASNIVGNKRHGKSSRRDMLLGNRKSRQGHLLIRYFETECGISAGCQAADDRASPNISLSKKRRSSGEWLETLWSAGGH